MSQPKYFSFSFFLLLSISFQWPICLADSGKDCSKDSECLPESERCSGGKCVCQICFAQSIHGNCSAVEFIAPCDSSTLADSCDNSCNGAQNEVYPANAFCDLRFGKVDCLPCFHAENGRCISNKQRKGPNLTCSDNCDCGHGLQCKNHCQCPKGFRWDEGRRACEKPEFADRCYSDEDCNSYGLTGRRNGYTYRGGKCDPTTKQCACAKSHLQTVVTLYDEINGYTYDKRICVVDAFGGNVDKGQGSQCDVDPVFVSDTAQASICKEGTVCFKCPEDSTPGRAICRTFNQTEERQVRKCVLTNDEISTANGTVNEVKLGLKCLNDSQCGHHERCNIYQVEPACETGICMCEACFSPNSSGKCAPNKFILYGEPCDVNAENEIYPTNAACIREEVRCKYGYRLSKDKLICQLDTFNYAGYGESCSLPYLNCHGNLECSMKKCSCPQIYERFDEEHKQCVPRTIGENCQLDSQCDREAIEAYVPTSMECSLTNSTCQCLPWANCSETTTTPTAKTYPDIVSDLKSCTIYQNISQANVIENVITTEEPNEQQQQQSTLGNNATTIDDSPKVGKICQVNDDCGPNEECFSQYEPPCGDKICQCKPCYGQGHSGRCEFVVYKALGNQCEGIENEMLLEPNAVCQNGTVRCDECFTAWENSKCLEVPGSLYGAKCNKDCQCDVASGLICNTYYGFCDCPDQSYRWSSSDKQCQLRDPENRHSAERCNTDDDCTMLGETRSGLCNTTLRRCSCTKDSDLYNVEDGQCVPRELGDSCSKDSNCFGYHIGHGLTVVQDGGKCGTNGTCQCGANFTAVSAKFLRKIPSLETIQFNKEICIRNDQLHLTKGHIGGSCSVTPLEDLFNVNDYGNDDSGLLCQSGGICVKCDEDRTNAKCRLRREKRRPTAEQCERERRAGQTTTRYTPSTSMLGSYCSHNDDCGPHEECTWTDVTKAMRPRCGSVGICVCQKGYVSMEIPDSMPRQKGCFKIPESVVVGNVNKKPHKNFGGNCTEDGDCNTFPDGNDQGYTYGGGRCVQGECKCADGYKETQLSFVVGNGYSVETKSICIHRLANNIVPASERCTTLAVLFSDSPRLRTCLQPSNTTAAVSVCYRCPFDVAGDLGGGTSPIKFEGYTPHDGVCRLVSL